MPHVWVFDRDTGAQVSTLDLCGGGQFTLLTGIGGEKWCEAARQVGATLGLEIACHVIGPRQKNVDHVGDWARAAEIGDTGCLLIRPDQHVGWRIATMVAEPTDELSRVFGTILAKG